jgi:multidrug efflux pump subunit AcrA (membrane-fusion protein)
VKTGGLVGEVSVKEGDWVESGAVLFSFDSEGAKKQLASLEKKIASIEKSPALKKSAEAKKKLDAAQADLESEQATLEVLEAKGKKAAMKMQEKQIEKAQTAVNQAQKAYDSTKSSGGNAADLEKLTADRDALKAMADVAPVKAPADGFVRELKVKSGEMLKAPATIAVMEDSKVLNAKLTAPEGQPNFVAGEEATLTINGKKVQAKITRVNGKEASATVENPKGNYKASAKGTLQAPGAERSLIGQYF